MSWLKDLAERNILDIFVTPLTSHPVMSRLASAAALIATLSRFVNRRVTSSLRLSNKHFFVRSPVDCAAACVVNSAPAHRTPMAVTTDNSLRIIFPYFPCNMATPPVNDRPLIRRKILKIVCPVIGRPLLTVRRSVVLPRAPLRTTVERCPITIIGLKVYAIYSLVF